MKKSLLALTVLALVLTASRSASANRSSFLVNGVTAIDGGALSLSLSTNHIGVTTEAKFFLSKTQPGKSLSQMQQGISVGQLTMDAGAMSHNLIISADHVKKLGVAVGTKVFVGAYWPKYSHSWGQIGRSPATFVFPKLKGAPKALSTPSNRSGKPTGLRRLRLKRRAPRVR